MSSELGTNRMTSEIRNPARRNRVSLKKSHGVQPITKQRKARRVLHVITAPQRRGAEMFALRLAAHLEEREFENAVCSLFQSSGALSSDYFPSALKSYELKAKARWLENTVHFNPAVLWRLYRAMRDFRPDVVVAHGSKTLKYASLGCLLYPRAKGVYKNIGTASFWANTWSKVRAGRLLLRNMHAVVSVSKYTREDFIKVYDFPNDRVLFIANAVDVSEFQNVDAKAARSGLRKHLGIGDEAIALINVGSLSPGKGQDEIIRLVPELIARGMDVCLILVGTGPSRPALEQLAENLDVTSKVHFLGLRKDISEVLSAGDIFVLTSATEGMPGVLIEAGMAGLPSVSYNVGGISEVVTDGLTGRLVSHGDSGRLLHAVGQLAADPAARVGMGAAARRYCYRTFNIEEIALQYKALFHALLDSESARDIGVAIRRLGAGAANGAT